MRRKTVAEDTAGVPRPAWQWLAAALIPLLTVLLGGGTERWSQATVLVAVGALLVLAPPRVSAGRTLNVVLAGLVLLAAAAFLPARWFPLPSWRAALVDDFDFALPGTISPQPILAAESAVLFLAGAAWFYLMVTFRWRAADRLRAGRVFAGGVIALAALFLVLHQFDAMPAFWHNQRRFGPFPNRNQTANFLAISAVVVLAVAQLRWQAKMRLEAAGWMGGLGVVLLALFTSFSRAGIIMFFAEVALYLLVEVYRSTRRRTRFDPPLAPKSPRSVPVLSLLNARTRLAGISLSLLMLLLSLFLLFGGSTLERLWPASAQSTVHAITGEFRLRIQADAVRMIDASPWCGLGLGSFSEIFALFRRLSAIPSRAIHPESDYLWAAAELGWPGLVLVIAGMARLGLDLGRSVRVSGIGADRRLRLAAALAVGAFVIHGFADVSAHRLGTSLCGLFLAGLALREKADDGKGGVDSGAPPANALAAASVTGFRALGVLLAGAGIIFACETAGWIMLPGQQGVDVLRARAERHAAAGNYAGAEAELTRAIAWAPLNWNLYFIRAGSRVYLGRDQEAVAADFRRARFLEPFIGDLPQAESKLWAAAGERTLAISALGEACRREPPRAEYFILEAIASAGRDKAFLDELAPFTRRDPAWMVAFVTHCVSPDTPGYVAAAVAENPDLHGLSDAQKTGFFRAWAEHGDPTALLAAMPQHPGWQALGWRWWAAAAAGAGHEEQACALANQWAARPTLPPLPPTEMAAAELRRRTTLDPSDPAQALQAYRAMSAEGDWSNVVAALRRTTAAPECPAYFFYLEADAAGKLGDWKLAWEAWSRYFAAAGIQT